jgi:hypothetical protein
LAIRIGGNGLGNLLLTWARCLSEAEKNGWQMIWPTWGSFKPKNWWANPYDHRTYTDLFRPTRRYLWGWRKPYRLVRASPWISEAECAHGGVPDGSVVQYRGMAGLFSPFLTSQSLVLSELLAMTRERHLVGYRNTSPAPIAIHVRRGDFIRWDSLDETASAHNSMLPIEWYISALKAVREVAGRPVPACVFSDGTIEELLPLTSMTAVTRVEYGSGLADMLALTRARLLIASGSTFSMWGTYLGQVPTVWHPGKRLQTLLLDRPDKEVEWAQGDPMPERMVRACTD